MPSFRHKLMRKDRLPSAIGSSDLKTGVSEDGPNPQNDFGAVFAARCSMTKQLFAAPTFYPQLLFPPRTINNF